MDDTRGLFHEGVVDGLDGLLGIGFVNTGDDVDLRRTLVDDADVHLVLAVMMLICEEPWSMMRTFTLFSARAVNSFAATPILFVMP